MLLWFGLGLVYAWCCVGLPYGLGLGLGQMWFACMGLIVSLGLLMCQSCVSSKACGLHLADVVVVWGGLGSCCVGM